MDEATVKNIYTFVSSQLLKKVSPDIVCQTLVARGMPAETANIIVTRAPYNPLNKQFPFGVIIDIVGTCNARCTWCVRGKLGNEHLSAPENFIDLALLARTLDRLLHIGAIVPHQLITLFNWGEPLLHPQFGQILTCLQERELWAEISSNGSMPPKNMEQIPFANIASFFFSMPGFSQKSYDRIHGFSFEKILRNIDLWIKTLLERGVPKRRIYISMHIYQFNLDEIKKAKTYFQDRYGITVQEKIAYLNGYSLLISYLKNEMSPENLKKAGQELFLYYIDDLLSTMPKTYACPLWKILTIDEKSNVITCCHVDPHLKEHVFGSVFDLSLEELHTRHANNKTCAECLSAGVIYSVFNTPKLEIFQ